MRFCAYTASFERCMWLELMYWQMQGSCSFSLSLSRRRSLFLGVFVCAYVWANVTRVTYKRVACSKKPCTYIYFLDATIRGILCTTNICNQCLNWLLLSKSLTLFLCDWFVCRFSSSKIMQYENQKVIQIRLNSMWTFWLALSQMANIIFTMQLEHAYTIAIAQGYFRINGAIYFLNTKSRH